MDVMEGSNPNVHTVTLHALIDDVAPKSLQLHGTILQTFVRILVNSGATLNFIHMS